MPGKPPAALLEFLGEAPSAAALRRPGSSGGVPACPSSARVREDSSPDTPGLPRMDGGFDDCRDYSGATAAENDTLGSGILDEGRTRQQKSSSSKPPRAAKGSPDTPKAARAAAAAGSAGGAPSKRSNSRGPEIEDLSKTCTPQPAGLASFLGEGFASPNAHQRPPDSGGSTHSGGTGRGGYGISRPRSGSRNRNMAASNSSCDLDGSPAHGLTKAAVALDPLGTSGGKRRFGGRG